MLLVYSINRGYLRETRPEFHYFYFVRVRPRCYDNAHYVGINALLTPIDDLWDNYYEAHSDGNTALADEIYENIQNAMVDLTNFIILNGTNNKARIEETGFTCNKTDKVAEDVPETPTNVRYMVLGEGNFFVRGREDKNAHQTFARTRLKGAPDTDWVEKEHSQNETVHFSGYTHNTDVEVQICAEGTAGRSNWSGSVFIPVD
jgi:hypothetical protein